MTTYYASRMIAGDFVLATEVVCNDGITRYVEIERYHIEAEDRPGYMFLIKENDGKYTNRRLYSSSRGAIMAVARMYKATPTTEAPAEETPAQQAPEVDTTPRTTVTIGRGDLFEFSHKVALTADSTVARYQWYEDDNKLYEGLEIDGSMYKLWAVRPTGEDNSVYNALQGALCWVQLLICNLRAEARELAEEAQRKALPPTIPSGKYVEYDPVCRNWAAYVDGHYLGSNKTEGAAMGRCDSYAYNSLTRG